MISAGSRWMYVASTSYFDILGTGICATVADMMMIILFTHRSKQRTAVVNVTWYKRVMYYMVRYVNAPND